MNKTHIKPLVFGFLFGTLGLYIIAMLALAFQPVEFLSSFLFYPGRFMAGLIAGAEGNDGEVVVLTLFNGIFYAIVFWLLSIVVKRKI